MVRITGDYQGDLHCSAAHGPSGTVISTDAPKDNQGRGEAFSPTDLVATGYGTCIATTLAIVARRHGVELKGLRYEVSKEMTTFGPRRIARLSAKIFLPAAARTLPEGLVERTAHGCPVHLSLAPEVERVIELVWE
jgi:putative redox protein